MKNLVFQGISSPVIDKKTLETILSHDDETIVRTSLAFVEYYRSRPWESPLVRLEDIPINKNDPSPFEEFMTFPATEISHMRENRVSSAKMKLIEEILHAKIPKGTVVAGEAVACCVSYGHTGIAVVDLFTFGGETREIEEILKEESYEFLRGLSFSSYSTFDGDYIRINKPKYRSPAEIVANFPLSCCKFFISAKDENRGIYTTLDGAISLYHKINIVDWKNETPTLWHTLERWRRRGFTIICPCLEPSKSRMKVIGAEIISGPKVGERVMPNLINLKELIDDVHHDRNVIEAAINRDPLGIYLVYDKDDETDEKTNSNPEPNRYDALEVMKDVLKDSEDPFYRMYSGDMYVDLLKTKSNIDFFRNLLEACPNRDPFAVQDEWCSEECCKGRISKFKKFKRIHKKLIAKRAEDVQQYLDGIYEKIENGGPCSDEKGYQTALTHPSEFWGRFWFPFSTAFCRREKFTVLGIWHFRRKEAPEFGRIPRDVLKYILRILDDTYVYDVLTTGLLSYGQNLVEPVEVVVDIDEEKRELIDIIKRISEKNPKALEGVFKDAAKSLGRHTDFFNEGVIHKFSECECPECRHMRGEETCSDPLCDCCNESF